MGFLWWCSMSNLKLSEIRKATADQLKQAMRELIENQHRLTLGEIHAMSRTILERGEKLGLDVKTINAWARGEK